MRNLKKFLAVVVAIAVMMTAMVPAFAADATATKTDAQICETLKVLQGGANGVTDEYLAKDTQRIQVAIFLLRLMGKETEARAYTDYKANFTDAKKVNASTQNLLGYLKDHPEYGFAGTPSGAFNVEEVAVPQHLYKVLLTVMGYKVGDAATDDYKYADTLKFAKETAKLSVVADLSKLTNNDVAKAIVEALKAKTKDGKVLIEKLVADKIVAEADAKAAGLIGDVASAITAKADGAKKIKVEFNAPVDTTKAAFVVKKGTITINVAKVAFADDKKSATLELATRLTAGDYSVSVSGLGEKALTADIKGVLDEKVSKIEFPSTNAVIDAVYTPAGHRVYTSYKVYNQYDEEVTASYTPSFNAGKGTTSVASAGTLLVTATSEFIVNEKLTVSALYSTSTSNAFASAVLTVVPKAQVADISIESIYNEDKKAPTAGESGSIYKLVVSAKDQYGNDVAWDRIAGDIAVTVSNTSVADIAGGANTPTFSQTSIDGTNKATLALRGTLTAGTSTITMIPKATGRLAKFDVVVKETAKVDTLTLSAPELAVAGEKVNIPFTAVDQFGNALTKDTDLNGGMTTALTAGSYPITFKQDYVKNTAYLELDLRTATAAQTVFVSGITKTGKIVSLQVNVVDTKKPVVINNTKDLKFYIATTGDIATTGKITLSENNLVAKDQYGRDITPDFGTTSGKYKYVVSTTEPTKVSLTGTEITADDGSVVLNGLAKGTSTINVKIVKHNGTDWEDVANSAISFDVKVVEKADIASYELADLGKTFENTNYGAAGKYEVDVTVNGVMADGAKVAVPAAYYNVIINDSKVGYTSGKVYSAARTWTGDATTVDVPVIVTVFASNGPIALTKNVTICKDAPAIATIELATSGIATKEGDGVVSAAYTDLRAGGINTLVVDAIKTVDQYGKELSEVASDYTFKMATNLPTGRAANLSDIAAGDTFNVMAVTSNGKTISFKVIVK